VLKCSDPWWRLDNLFDQPAHHTRSALELPVLLNFTLGITDTLKGQAVLCRRIPGNLTEIGKT